MPKRTARARDPQRRERELEALHAIATKVAAASSIGVICRVAARKVTRLLGYSGAAILLLSGEEGAETLELCAKDGPVPGELLAALGGPPGPLENAALRSRRPQVVRELADPRLFAEEPIAGRARFVEKGFHAAAMIPIVAAKRTWGLLGVVAGCPEMLDPQAIQVLGDVCRAIGTALDKRRLLDVAHKRIEDIRFFRDVSAWIAGTIDLDRLLSRICNNLSQLVDVPQCFVLLHDTQNRSLYGVAATQPYTHFLPQIRIPTSTKRSLAVRCFKTKKPVAVYDVANDPRANKRLVRLFKETSILAIPLLIRGEAIGTVMLAETRRLRAFSEDEIARGQAVANQAALAIENALRHRDAVAARDRAEMLLDTVHDCSSSVDVNEIMRRIARRTVAMTSANRCAFWMPDEQGRLARVVEHGMPRRLRPRMNALIGRQIEDFPVGRGVLSAKRPLVYADIGKEGGVSAALAKSLQIKAVVAAPVRGRGRFLAALAVAYPDDVKSVPPEDVGLIDGIANQIAMAIENANAFEEIGRQRLALDVLTARMIGAQEEERRRIARELHDGVSQTLTAVKFELERLGRRPGAGDEIRHAAATIGEAIGEVRRLCMDLRPSSLDHLGLVATLEWFGRSFSKRSGIPVDMDLPEEPPGLTPDQEINLYRIAQEALNNVAKHARATRAAVRLRVRPRRLELSVIDDGKGFDPRSVERSHADERGMGLLTMSERAHLLGGEARVRSKEGRGTTVEVKVPLRVPVKLEHEEEAARAAGGAASAKASASASERERGEGRGEGEGEKDEGGGGNGGEGKVRGPKGTGAPATA